MNKNLLGRRIKHNIRTILERGGGLPFFFPHYELGFSYAHQQQQHSLLLGPEDDTTAGGRHVLIDCVCECLSYDMSFTRMKDDTRFDCRTIVRQIPMNFGMI
jgi:hypothetical protein